jgi:hypothetical protein
VGSINKLRSGSDGLRGLIDELRDILAPSDTQIAIRHIPGRLNTLTDADSRVGEQAFVDRPLALDIVSRCEDLLNVNFQAIGAAGPPPHWATVSLTSATELQEGVNSLWVPPPQSRIEILGQLRNTPCDGRVMAIVLPTLDEFANGRFRHLLHGAFSLVHEWPQDQPLAIYDSDLSVSPLYTTGTLSLPRVSCGWSVWQRGGNMGHQQKHCAARQLQVSFADLLADNNDASVPMGKRQRV